MKNISIVQCYVPAVISDAAGKEALSKTMSNEKVGALPFSVDEMLSAIDALKRIKAVRFHGLPA